MSTDGARNNKDHDFSGFDGPTILILYATETGTAQDVAERIARESIERTYKTRIMSMDQYPLDHLIDEPLVIFVCSTTGTGTEPRTMTPLWKMLLRKDLPGDLLDATQFAVFGLGDSGYEKFNWAAKKLQRRLLSLGAVEICERGDANDQDAYGVDSTLDPWILKLFHILSELYPDSSRPSDLSATAKSLPPPRAILTSVSDLASQNNGLNLYNGEDGRIAVSLSRNDRITSPEWYQDVRHIEFEANVDLSYEPGDVAVLYPENTAENVEWLLNRMEWATVAGSTFALKASNDDWPLSRALPARTTLRELITRYLDISSVPRRSFFEWLRHFTDNEVEIEKLEEFCSKDGQDELFTYTTRARRTIIEVLSEFRSVKIPLGYILDVFPTIRPRQFSISSACKVHPQSVHLCVAIVMYKTKLIRSPRKGLCTSWLSDMPIGTRLCIGLEEGTMKLPSDPSKPIIMVGPGTGVAPLRAFLEERIRQNAKENILYFGCRSSSADCHYGYEWVEYQRRGQLIYRLAASRDQDSKVYVQHLITDDSATISELILDRGAHMYICGSSNQMPKAVRRAVEGALSRRDQWDEAKAAEYVKAMEQDGRWAEECWS